MPRRPNNFEMLEIHAAASTGNISTLHMLRDMGVHVLAKNSYGQDALDYAVSHDSTNAVKTLLKFGASPLRSQTYLGKDRTSPLLAYAASRNTPEICQALIAAGAKVDQPDSLGRTPLLVACETGSLHTAQCLLEHGADVNFPSPTDGTTAMHCAALSPKAPDPLATKLLDLLLAAGAQIKAKDNGNQTALGNAIASADIEKVKWFLSHGLSPADYDLANPIAAELAARYWDDLPTDQEFKNLHIIAALLTRQTSTPAIK